jgi:hypothetical protein
MTQTPMIYDSFVPVLGTWMFQLGRTASLQVRLFLLWITHDGYETERGFGFFIFSVAFFGQTAGLRFDAWCHAAPTASLG